MRNYCIINRFMNIIKIVKNINVNYEVKKWMELMELMELM